MLVTRNSLKARKCFLKEWYSLVELALKHKHTAEVGQCRKELRIILVQNLSGYI